MKTANGTLLQCTGVGEVRCRLQDNKTLILYEVYLAPELDSNLISSNEIFEFHCYVQKGALIKLDTLQEIGTLQRKIPVITAKVLQPNMPHVCSVVMNAENLDSDAESSASTSDDRDERSTVTGMELSADSDVLDKSTVENSMEWHLRFGHPGAALFAQLKKIHKIKGAAHILFKDCEGCLASKFVQSIPKKSEQLTKVDRPFEMLHVDLSGPFHSPTAYDNAQYFLTIVDRYSKFVHAVPIKSKNEAGGKLIEFMRQTYNTLQATHYPRQVRSDNGNEFVNSQVNEFFSKHGIQGKYTQGYSSYQNGVAERMNRLLQDKVRIFLTQGNVPLEFWSEALRLAAAVLNFTPRQLMSQQTPVDLFYPEGKAPMNRMFHTFGCLAYARYPKLFMLSKLRPHGVNCAYLGPGISRAGHRFFTYDPPHVFESDEAMFQETRFYFKEYHVSTDILETMYGTKTPSVLLPPIKYPPAAKRRSKEHRQVDMIRLHQLFELNIDISDRAKPTPNDDLSHSDSVPPADVAKINLSFKGSLTSPVVPTSSYSLPGNNSSVKPHQESTLALMLSTTQLLETLRPIQACEHPLTILAESLQSQVTMSDTMDMNGPQITESLVPRLTSGSLSSVY